jgi:two-component system nitrate/nitrite response regulator NarL
MNEQAAPLISLVGDLGMPIRVLIADDHEPTREDIRAALESADDLSVCAEAADAAEAVAAASVEKPDVCVLDLNMPGSGTAAAWEICARLPNTRVLILTVFDDDAHLFPALRAGASGYLLKNLVPGQLQEAIRAVMRGEATMPGALLARVLDEFRERGPRRRHLDVEGAGQRLTSREWEVLELLCRGLTTGEISRELSVSKATVRSHAASVLRKLELPDRESAVSFFNERAETRAAEARD